MKRRKASRGIFVDVAVLLLCLAIATSCLASGMFAKYASSSGTAAATANIASFNVGAALDKEEYEVDLSRQDNAESVIALQNNSEVAVYYTVTLVFGSKVDGFITPELDGVQAAADTSGAGTVYEWKNVAVIDCGDTASPVLGFTVDGEPAGNEYLFQVIVTFTQVE